MTDREIVAYLAKHFVVRNGPNSDKSQYGHLELWWAAADVAAESSAMRNPFMLLGTAENSYSLAAMGELRALIDHARENTGGNHG